ncbi:MAG: DNA-directed RNA polymerase subunit omega [Oscillospiraceae bacterium]|jgi:DNA-directed RNA polymerase subunit omega|nr:DNA-directed RNA polymerase subunit omega [Oscillospiraceae bacterium]
MLNVDVRVVLGKHTSRYSLVTAVAKRARELVNETDEESIVHVGKPVTLALNDFVEGRYAILEPEEIRNI